MSLADTHATQQDMATAASMIAAHRHDSDMTRYKGIGSRRPERRDCAANTRYSHALTNQDMFET